MKSFTLRLGIKITNFGTDLIHDVVQLLSCMLLVSSTKGYKVLTVIFNSQEPNNGITSRHNSALSWMLGPYILGLYFFSLNISVNIIFIILNIRLKNKGIQELIPRLTFRTKNEYNLIFWKLTMTVLANVQNRCNGIKNNCLSYTLEIYRPDFSKSHIKQFNLSFTTTTFSLLTF